MKLSYKIEAIHINSNAAPYYYRFIPIELSKWKSSFTVQIFTPFIEKERSEPDQALSVRFARVMIHDRLAFRMRRRSASSASIHEIILWRLFDYQT